MARNRLQERDNTLPNVDYEPLLKEILAVLKKRADMFQITPTRLQILIDSVAQEVVARTARTNFQDIRPFIPSRGLTHVSANFLDGNAFNVFRLLIERIRDQLASHCRTALASTLPARTIEEYCQQLLSGPQDFTGNTISALHYSFGKTVNLKKRRLHLQARRKPGQADTRLLGHKLTITVRDMYVFEQQLVEALCNVVETLDDPPSDREIERIRTVLEQRLQDSGSEQGVLLRIIRKESFGRLQKEAKIRYLEYLARSLKEKTPSGGEKGLLLLQTLAQRLRMLEAFLRDEKPDDYYQVSYLGYGANYRSLFSRSEVLDLLPIFADIEGALGETFQREKGEQVFTLGIKLKLNGRFRTYASVFQYYLKLLDPLSEEHQERKTSKRFHIQAFVEKVLKLALLYYFVFKNMEDPTYNPAHDVEHELLSFLGDGEQQLSDEAKGKKLHAFVVGLSQAKYSDALETLRSTLKTCVKSAGSEFDVWPTRLYLSVSADILDIDGERMRNEKKFFRTDALQEKGMGMLKYMTIEEASTAGNTLCSLPVSFTFEPLYYYSSTDELEQNFSMRYNISRVGFLPVIFTPSAEGDLTVCQQYYQSYKHIEITYAPELSYATNPIAVFVHHFTYLLLCYICLKLFGTPLQTWLLGQNKRLFLPLLRIHVGTKPTEQEEKPDEGAFIRALSKTLAHLLCEQDMLANAQGLHIDAFKPLSGRHLTQRELMQRASQVNNALSSLYSVLPKVFELPTPPRLDNLAIIVVSSRKCDAHKDTDFYLSSIYGEVVGIRRYGQTNRVQVVPLSAFAANEDSENLYRMPTVLQDQAKKWYLRGYRHILYVAQAPYSSSLHLTSAETAEEQFFMSGSIIQSLKHGQSDLSIYPVYCDKFYVVKVSGNITESLYVDDTRELRDLASDPNRSSVVFFNLLNGIIVGGERMQRLYNGVVSYATLINVYDDPIYDQNIRNHLLDSSQPDSLKKDILDFLTLLHFARYEREASSISMKLDPYENIIGSDSVGTLGIIDHTEPGIRFNMLAFLTEVRSVLNRQFSGYSSLLLDEEEQGVDEAGPGADHENGDQSEPA
jgi:hypothetical protein